MDDQRENRSGGSNHDDSRIDPGGHRVFSDISRAEADMSLAWQQGDDNVRSAGQGPLMQLFIAQVAYEMRRQNGAAAEIEWEQFGRKIARSQRRSWLSHWREIVTAAGAILFWVACWWIGGHWY